MHVLAEPTPVRRIRNGEGDVTLSHVAGRTVVTRAAASSPLKLLTPRAQGDAAWIFTSTYGGGLLGGDTIRLDLHAQRDTRCLLSTQASTKVYRSLGETSHQSLHVRADEDSLVISAPDPVVCFAAARYAQHQRFDLADSAGLVLIDWLTSGRHARGERWAFDRYESETEIRVADRTIFRERLVLDPGDGPLDAPMRMGLFDCFGTVIVAGKSLRAHAEQLLKFVAAQPASRNTPVLCAASEIESGVILRVAGSSTESLARWIHERLLFVIRLIGENPWSRKW